MKIEILTPEENMGDVIGDMNRRRGQLQGMDTRAGSQVIKAQVPLSEMFGYVTQLRTITSGRATSTMEFDHYAEAPRNVQEGFVRRQERFGRRRDGTWLFIAVTSWPIACCASSTSSASDPAINAANSNPETPSGSECPMKWGNTRSGADRTTAGSSSSCRE